MAPKSLLLLLDFFKKKLRVFPASPVISDDQELCVFGQGSFFGPECQGNPRGNNTVSTCQQKRGNGFERPNDRRILVFLAENPTSFKVSNVFKVYSDRFSFCMSSLVQKFEQTMGMDQTIYPKGLQEMNQRLKLK